MSLVRAHSQFPIMVDVKCCPLEGESLLAGIGASLPCSSHWPLLVWHQGLRRKSQLLYEEMIVCSLTEQPLCARCWWRGVHKAGGVLAVREVTFT